MKAVDVKWRTCVDFGVEKNGNNRKCKVGDQVRILKHKTFFAKFYTPNCSEERFVIKK